MSTDDLTKYSESKLFKTWLDKMLNKHGLAGETGSLNGRVTVDAVEFQSVDMFGPNIGFLKFVAIVRDSSGLKLPGIVFARGGSVAILLLLDVDGKHETQVVLTCQARVPVGRLTLEIPAGMLDSHHNFSGAAAKELLQETGIKIQQSDLFDLTSLLKGTPEQAIFPSPGGCDEDMRLYVYKEKMSAEEFKKLQERQTGVREEGEVIRLHVVPYGELWRTTMDAKALSAIALYEGGLRTNQIPERYMVSNSLYGVGK